MRIHASLLVGVFTVAILGVGCVPRSSRDSYERCFVAADCATSSDRCLTVVNGSNSDSMCSSSCSGPSAFCPRDWMGVPGDCRNVGSGSFDCYQACRNDSDCLSGFQCLTPGVGGAPICLPAAGSTVLSQSYEGCFVAADCATSSDRCLSVVNGSASASMCSSTCSGPSAFCPRDWMGVAGDCRDIGTGSFNCYQACRTDGDCLSGLRCIVPGVGGAPVCIPG